MKDTEIKFKRLKEVIEEAVAGPHSDFYKKKYLRVGFDYRTIDSPDGIGSIPLLSKSEVLAAPLQDRIFVPEDEVFYYSWSSGTTDPSSPMIVPHTERGSVTTSKASRVWSGDLKIERVLFLRSPLDPGLMKLMHASKESDTVVVPGNVGNLGLTAKIAGEIGIDAIFTTPTTLSFFIDYMKKVGTDRSTIKLISLRGELCSSQKFESFKKEFPNAEIDIKYGGSEIGEFIGYRCRHMVESPPNEYHPSPNCMVEAINGEIVYSDLSTGKAFPLIRYRTEDIGELTPSECSCGNDLLLSLKGRMGNDVLRFRGMTLYFGSIEDSLDEVKGSIEPGMFRMSIREENGKPAMTLEIKLVAKAEADERLKERIVASVSRRLFLPPAGKLGDLIAKGDLSPLKVEFITDWPQEGLKSRNIISHL